MMWCSNRFPPEFKGVLAYSEKYRKVGLAWREGGGWRSSDPSLQHSREPGWIMPISHWAEVEEPPRSFGELHLRAARALGHLGRTDQALVELQAAADTVKAAMVDCLAWRHLYYERAEEIVGIVQSMPRGSKPWET